MGGNGKAPCRGHTTFPLREAHPYSKHGSLVARTIGNCKTKKEKDRALQMLHKNFTHFNAPQHFTFFLYPKL